MDSRFEDSIVNYGKRFVDSSKSQRTAKNMERSSSVRDEDYWKMIV